MDNPCLDPLNHCLAEKPAEPATNACCHDDSNYLHHLSPPIRIVHFSQPCATLQVRGCGNASNVTSIEKSQAVDGQATVWRLMREAAMVSDRDERQQQRLRAAIAKGSSRHRSHRYRLYRLRFMPLAITLSSIRRKFVIESFATMAATVLMLGSAVAINSS